MMGSTNGCMQHNHCKSGKLCQLLASLHTTSKQAEASADVDTRQQQRMQSRLKLHNLTAKSSAVKGTV